MVLDYELARYYIAWHFLHLLQNGRAVQNVFARLQLGKYALKISKDLRKVEAAPYSTIRRRREKGEQLRQAKRMPTQRALQTNAIWPLWPSSAGRPTHLHTRSKCKASSFVWNGSENSPQRASPSKAGRKKGKHELTAERKRQHVNIDCDLLAVLSRTDPKITGMRPWHHSTASPANAGTKHGWVQTPRHKI